MISATFLTRCDIVQNSRLYKLIASAILIVAAVAGYFTYWAMTKDSIDTSTPWRLEMNPDLKADGTPNAPTQEDLSNARSELERFNRSLDRIMSGRADYTSVAVAIGSALLLSLAAIWLSISLSLLMLLLGAGLVSAPLAAFESTRDWSRLIVALAVLGSSFTVLMRLLNLALSSPGPVMAIARNVLAEATRLRLSVMFIVLILFALATLPFLLDAERPLRYRVQMVLQYGTGGIFWGVALLVVLFSVASVATEQRGRVIWQTMTKPVAAWQYILGKWIGVVSLAAALLAVSGAGVFLFVEYLRSQPAQGEVGPFKTSDGSISPDRQWLETQILASRVLIPNTPQDLRVNDPARFAQAVESYMRDLAAANSAFNPNDPGTRMEVEESLAKALEQQYRTLDSAPGMTEYVFEGLGPARDADLPIIFRYRLDVGSNRPDLTYKFTLLIQNYGMRVVEVPPGQYMTLALPSLVVDPEGKVRIRFANAFPADDGQYMINAEAASFPKDGLSMSFSLGSWRLNFARVIFVLWIKLAFLAMVGIFAATFLSFAVASMTALGVFAAAESAVFIRNALEVFSEYDPSKTENVVVLWRWVVVTIARSVSSIFQVYAELKPTEKLVEGLHLAWGSVTMGSAAIALATVITFVLASEIFRRRELAMYSGS